MNILKHTFGTDPEAFIFDKFINDPQLGKIPNIIPPIALVQDYGANYKVIKNKNVLISKKDFQWSEDGAAIELQMNPTDNEETFTSRLKAAKLELIHFLEPYKLHAITNFPVGYFNIKKYWKGRDENFRNCVIFGCDPDMSPELYFDLNLEKQTNKQILNVENHNYRYGGGHIHIQAPKNNPDIYLEQWPTASIIFDFFAGLTNVLFPKLPQINKLEKFRLKYYGKPGRIRLQWYNEKLKIHGIEYRVLPNTWTENELFTKTLLNSLDTAATIIETNLGEDFVYYFKKDIPDVYKAIITLNKSLATNILIRCQKWAKKNNVVSI